ncbi:MAG: LCP family protein [Anaerolineae bacterium]
MSILLFAVLVLGVVNSPLVDSAHGLAVPNPLSSQTLFARLLQPFAAEAQARRLQRARTDADYAHRVDAALATGRVNFLLFGYGETFEPPFTTAIIGSYTIVSVDTQTGQADLISLTHDVRAPEIERALAQRGQQVHAVKIDQAYSVGGFDLMRRTVEDATGLPIDFQISFKDVVIKDLVDSVFEQVPVEVPADFDTAPFYLDGQKYDTAHMTQGVQQMNGTQVIQFMKSLEAGDSQAVQRNARKELVLRGLLAAATDHCSDRGFWLKMSGLLVRQQWSGDVAYDFDPAALLVDNIGQLGSGFGDLLRYKTCTVGAPQIARTQYIVDPESGGDGVRWASSDATVNPIARQDIDSGVYQAGGLGVAVPLNGDPYGDLVTGYWGSVRALVKQTLSEK